MPSDLRERQAKSKKWQMESCFKCERNTYRNEQGVEGISGPRDSLAFILRWETTGEFEKKGDMVGHTHLCW